MDRVQTDWRPVVSVIVPARDEEACLAACLESLGRQDGIAFELIVVDDGSTDGTPAIARSFPGVQLIQAAPPAVGCSGKCNAAQAGADYARGEWLLFTDADTVHEPGSLAAALAEARARRVALLSYSPRQQVRGFWQRAVMPVIFAELASTYRPREVSNPVSPAAAANGQYLLVSHRAYDAVGGHAAVARTLLEDVALARLLKQSGRRIFFRYGGDRVQTRMYRSFPQLVEGWTKNLALLFPRPVLLAALRAFEFLTLAGATALAADAWLQRRMAWSALAAGVAVAAAGLLLARIRRAHFDWLSTLLAPLGLPLFAYLLLRSQLSYRWKKRVTWKGRSYLSCDATSSPAPEAGLEERVATGDKWSI